MVPGLLRYRTCIWCTGNEIFGWDKYGLDMQNEVHQKYIRYIMNAGGRAGNFLFRLTEWPFLNRQGEPREN